MSMIKVHRPIPERDDPVGSSLAARGNIPDGARLTVIDNGKPRAKDLLCRIADRVGDKLRIGEVDIHTKPSAGAPIDADVARMLAARSHLVISGLGD